MVHCGNAARLDLRLAGDVAWLWYNYYSILDLTIGAQLLNYIPAVMGLYAKSA